MADVGNEKGVGYCFLKTSKHVYVLTPGTCECDFYLKTGSLQMLLRLLGCNHFGLRVGPKSSDWYPYEKGDLKHTETQRRSCDYGGRYWRAGSTRVRIAGKHQELGQRRGKILPQSPEETYPADIWISDFWTPEL